MTPQPEPTEIALLRADNKRLYNALLQLYDAIDYQFSTATDQLDEALGWAAFILETHKGEDSDAVQSD